MPRIGSLLCKAAMIGLMAGGVACATNADSYQTTARQFLQTVYARYTAHGHPIDIGSEEAENIYAPALLALLREDRRTLAGEAGVLDADPICACQDYDIRSVKVDVKPMDAHRFSATARFHNLGVPQTIRFDLLRTASGWRIADIHEPNIDSLQSSLEDEIKSAGKQPQLP